MTLHFIPAQPFENPSIVLDLNTELASAMNTWRLARKPPLGATEAICELLRIALTAEGIPLTLDAQNGDPQVRALIKAFKQSQTERLAKAKTTQGCS
jgi:hypothetical protein